MQGLGFRVVRRGTQHFCYGFCKNAGSFLGGPNHKDYNIFRLHVGGPYLWKHELCSCCVTCLLLLLTTFILMRLVESQNHLSSILAGDTMVPNIE